MISSLLLEFPAPPNPYTGYLPPPKKKREKIPLRLLILLP